MPKKIVQDIVPNKKRTIRNIPSKKPVDDIEEDFESEVVKAKPVRRPRQVREDIDEEEIEPVIHRRSTVKKTRQFSMKYLAVFIVTLVSVILIGLALSLSYSKAIVTITPKVVNLDINGTYTAKKGAETNDLGYEVVTSVDEIRNTLTVTKGPLIQTKSKGTVTVYNAGTAPQVLVAGSRISNPDGLVYRTSNTVTIPAKKLLKDGAIDVVVVADKASETYNLKLSAAKYDFKFPAYKGTDKYDKIYARLKTDLTGGFYGSKPIIAQDVKNNTIKIMQDTLKEQLLKKIKDTVPKDYTYYDGAYSIKYEAQEPILKPDNKAEFVLKGTLYLAIFKTDSLIKSLAGTEARKFPSDTYVIKGDKELAYKLSNTKDFSVDKGTPMIFNLKGSISILGTIPEEKLKNELKGIKLNQSNAVFNKYGSIASAYSLITPFWLSSFPDSVSKIKIEYK